MFLERKQPAVLVVDDEPFIQFAFSTLLTKLGCAVEKASNGKIAVEMVMERLKSDEPMYDIVFMDANMPVMSGYDAAKMIKQDPHLTVPIVCVSAQDSIKHQALCRECGMAEISKSQAELGRSKQAVHSGQTARDPRQIRFNINSSNQERELGFGTTLPLW